MRNKKRKGVRMVRIHVNNNEELSQGAREVGAMLDELGAYLAQRSQKVCRVCQQTEWMDPDQTVCWKCDRRAHGLPVLG